jgi:hypothetical protein
MKKRLMWVVAGLMAVGIGVTLVDYIGWRHAETDKYGQGWNDLKSPAEELSNMYQDPIAGFRLRLPKGWKLGELVTVTMASSDIGLTEIVTDRVEALKSRGIKLDRDWEYANSEKINMTVITWEEEQSGGTTLTRQEAMAKKGPKMLDINVSVPTGDWGKYENTFWEIYKNAEIL